MEAKKEQKNVMAILKRFCKEQAYGWWAVVVQGKGTPREPWATPEEIMRNPHIKEYIKKHNKVMNGKMENNS